MNLVGLAKEAMRRKNREQAVDVVLGILGSGEETDAEVVEDAALPDLAKHDKRFHGGHFDERTMTCSLRDKLSKSDNPDALVAAHEAKMGKMSNRKAEEYVRMMAKKCPQLDPEETLEKLSAIDDAKLQGDAFRWLMRGKVRLPEDMYKVREARVLADKAKKDPLRYDTPQACINDLQGLFKHGGATAEDRIDPDTVPELTDRREMGEGVVTYAVQDDQQGQMAMRRIIDTHWGKDANPWCLLARTKDQDREDEDAEDRFKDWWYGLSADKMNEYGKTDIFTDENKYDDEMSIFSGGEAEKAAMTAQEYYFAHVDHTYQTPLKSMGTAWHYWHDVYNALPKRVAFRNGKLLAFMATNGVDTESEFPQDAYLTWLDDNGFMEGEDGTPTYEEWYDKYWTDKKPPEQWWDRNDDAHDNIPFGNLKIPNDPFGRYGWFELRDGKAVRVGGYAKGKPNDENFTSWYANGQVAKVRTKDTTREWNEDGTLSRYLDSNNIRNYYYEDGKNGDVHGLSFYDPEIHDEYEVAIYRDGMMQFKDPTRATVQSDNSVTLEHWPTEREYKIDASGKLVDSSPMGTGYNEGEITAKLENGIDMFGETAHSYEDVARILWKETMRKKAATLEEMKKAKELWKRESKVTMTPEKKADLKAYLGR